MRRSLLFTGRTAAPRSAQGCRAGVSRRGAATVEFAVLAPLFLLLVLGTVELGSAINHSQTMHSALREAGRLASMDYKQILPPDTNINLKITQDLRNFLTAGGIPGNLVTISIEHAGGANDGQPFDLSDPDNELELFRILASVPYPSVSAMPLRYMEGQTLTAQMTYRKGRVSLVGGP